MEEAYTKREQDYHFKVILDKLEKQDDNQLEFRNEMKKELSDIKIQTTKTNGSVARHKIFFKVAWTSLGIIGTLICLFIPLFFKTIKEDHQERQRIIEDITTIKQTLENYDFEIIE